MIKRILIDLLHIRDTMYTGVSIVPIEIVKGFISFSEYKLVLLIWDGQQQWYEAILGQNLEVIPVLPKMSKMLDNKFKIKFCPKCIIDKIEEKK